ncbi:hypothetical protein L9F63_004627, partial [Diploptera punctata]
SSVFRKLSDVLHVVLKVLAMIGGVMVRFHDEKKFSGMGKDADKAKLFLACRASAVDNISCI